MEKRVSLVALGLADPERSSALYEALGWEPAARAFEGIRFFCCGCPAMSLYRRGKLAEDIGLPAEVADQASIFSSVILA